MKSKIDKKQTIEFLRKVPVASIAVVDGDKPLSSVVLFAVDDDLTLYMSTHSTSRKAKALDINNKISLSIWENKQILVQIDGTVTKLNDNKKMRDSLDKIIASTVNIEDFWPPILNVDSDHDYVVYKIKPKWVRVLDLSNDKINFKASPFTEIKL